MSVDIGQIASRYPGRGRRGSLDAVAELRAALPAHPEPPAIGVVGTNGKSSTAAYLSRLLTAAGLRTGSYTSPHLSSWGERVRIDGVACDEEELAETLEEVGRLAVGVDRRELRFFDVLTLAAELIFARHEAAAVVCEAGIGGRLDAVRLLRPRLTLFTGVALDHAEILGAELEQILREKLLLAPAGGDVLASRLPPDLERRAEELARECGFGLGWVDEEAEPLPAAAAALAGPLRRSLAIAIAGRRWAERGLGAPPLGSEELERLDLAVPGRCERGRWDGVPYLLDSAHNRAAWQGLVAELEREPLGGGGSRLAAVASLSPDKERVALAEALASLRQLDLVLATRHHQLPAVDPGDLAADLRRAGLRTAVEDDPLAAVGLARARARELGGGVLVLGSTHLVAEVRRRMVGAGQL